MGAQQKACKEKKKVCYTRSSSGITNLSQVSGQLRKACKYTLEIPEPALSLFQQEALIWPVWGFHAIKIPVIHEVRMYCSLSVKINRHERAGMDFVCVCFGVRG